MRLTPYWKRAVGVARSLPYDLAVTGDYAIPEGVAGLGVPTLVLHGDHTQPLLVHGAQGLARTLPGAVLKVLPGVNHQVKTSDLAPVVANFLKGEEA
jgi:pimeloyl-ACP methyl ester carboxylesterase